jgi:hypothetical protein
VGGHRHHTSGSVRVSRPGLSHPSTSSAASARWIEAGTGTAAVGDEQISVLRERGWTKPAS